jgi:predicted aspartyl protease
LTVGITETFKSDLPAIGRPRWIAVGVILGELQRLFAANLLLAWHRYSEFASKADAIIGMDLLQLNNITIDFAAGKLIFDPTAPTAYAVGGDPMAKCLVVQLQVQDRPVHLIVDTGLQGILLYKDRLRQSVPGLRTTGSIKNATMGGRLAVKQATLPDVVFGTRNRQVPVLLMPSPGADMLPGIDGIVGIAALQARRVHFDFSSKTLSWE